MKIFAAGLSYQTAPEQTDAVMARFAARREPTPTVTAQYAPGWGFSVGSLSGARMTSRAIELMVMKLNVIRRGYGVFTPCHEGRVCPMLSDKCESPAGMFGSILRKLRQSGLLDLTKNAKFMATKVESFLQSAINFLHVMKAECLEMQWTQLPGPHSPARLKKVQYHSLI